MSKIFMAITSLYSGGAERVMSTLANGLVNEHDVEIVTVTSDEAFYKLDERIRVRRFGGTLSKKNKLASILSKAASIVEFFFAMRKAIKKEKPDVIIAFMDPVIKPILLLKTLMRFKCKVIVSERADPTVRSAFKRWRERSVYPKADVVVCQAQNVVKFFKEKDQSKCIVIPNPVCAEAIPPFYTGERKKCIVAVGRLTPQKNFTMLINAFSKLPKEFNDYTLEIYGDGPLKSTLQDQINDLGLNDRAFLMGVKKNVMYDLADKSLFVMSSNYEGFPNALLEAMSTGLPVISTDFPTGVAQEIVKEENGIVIPVGDESALIDAIIEILSSYEKRASMSIENRKYLDIYSEEAILKMWEKCIE